MWHDLTGQIFNNLKVIGKNPTPSANGERRWDCICLKCGGLITLRTYDLLSKRNQSCGCSRQLHLKGQKFGHLTVLDEASPEYKKTPEIVWKCECDCTNHEIRYVTTNDLTSGKITKCRSCSEYDRKTYKTVEEKLLSIRYRTMRTRCYNKNSPDYPNWGGRGITVCDEWLDDIWSFIHWSLANGFKPGLSIDRKDNDGPYSPENCRWVDMSVQANNRRTNVFIEACGKRLTCSQWSYELGFRRYQINRWYHDLGYESVVRTIETLMKRRTK